MNIQLDLFRFPYPELDCQDGVRIRGAQMRTPTFNIQHFESRKPEIRNPRSEHSQDFNVQILGFEIRVPETRIPRY